MASKTILISVPEDLAAELERAWRYDMSYKSRSEFIAKAIRNQIYGKN